MATPERDPAFNGTSAVALHYGISRDTVLRRIKDGTLAAYKFGPRSYRIKFEDAEKAFRVKAQS